MKLPPLTKNSDGKLRRVGFELEFGGLDVRQSAMILARLLDGKIESLKPFTADIASAHGTFHVEFDSTFFKERQYEEFLDSLGIAPSESRIGKTVEKALVWLGELVVPFEIVTPPLPMDQIAIIEKIRRALYANSAKGTTASPVNAFGLQFNPEVPDFSAETLVSYMQAFFLLYDQLRAETHIPAARKLAPYIHPFPKAYVHLVTNPGYRPQIDEFMRDYLEHNPTRNRPLDLLPLFGVINPELLFSYPVEKNLVKPRPTFHYRLPNSEVDNPDWSISREWDRWLEVEELAFDKPRLQKMCQEFTHV
jgi:hypothetical protein